MYKTNKNLVDKKTIILKYLCMSPCRGFYKPLYMDEEIHDFIF